jgi:long-chain acyl-CoA synthetase
MASTQVAPLLDEIRASAREGAILRPDANLELDLGIDSMARVELVATLEHRAGAVVPEATAQCLFTVRDVVDAVLCGRTDAAGRQDGIDAWTALLSAEVGGGPTLTEAATGGSDRVVWLFHAAVRAILFLSRVVIEYDVSGTRHLPARGPYLICPNHESYIDPFVLAGHLPFHVVRQLFHIGATEYLQSPLTAWAARQVRLLPVDPDSGLLPAMRASAAGLRAGRILVLFPEGERSIDGRVRPFKQGAAILASHLGVPVVPVALDGLFELWPRSRPFDWRRLRPWRRHRVTIRIGPAIAPHSSSEGRVVGGAPPGGARAFTERLRDVIVELQAWPGATGPAFTS